jgi:SM-20-related protein
VCDNFLEKSEVENLLKTFSIRYEQGKFRQASIGKSDEAQQNIEIRGDEILWLDNHSTDLAERVLLNKNQEFINYLNKTCYLGIIDSEIHFAKFAKGKFYRRHRDTFQKKQGRVFSVIYYLNVGWTQENGGNLIIYVSNSGIEKAVTITPLAGRMVCFESEKLDHEVTEAFLDRFSITGWLLKSI